VARGFTKDRNATLEKRRLPSAAGPRPASTGINGNGTIRQGDEIFGRLVAVRRAALGLRQEDLAARMETSQANVAGIENGRPSSLETLERLAVALAAEPRTGSAWSSLGGRWRWGGLAIAILVAALVILSGHSGENGGGASSQRLPEAASPAPAAPTPAVRVDAHGAHGKPLRETKKQAKAQKTKGATRDERGNATDQEPPQSAPHATLTPTSPTEPAPRAPSDAVSPQPSGSGSPSAPLKPTGKPDGSPGNGPDGGGGSGGGSGGGNGSGGSNGPGGTGPPGQMR
jgi:DNA-binding XRE family transcriptional regulator